MPLVESQPDALARTYARSLYELTSSKGGRQMVEDTLGELEEILDLARADARFGEFFASRSLNAKARAASLERIFKGRVSEFTYAFLQILNAKGRIGHISAVVAAFDSIVQEKFGRVEVDVYTAAPLDASGVQTLRDRLGASLKKDVVLHPFVEPSMLGGVKVRIGDQLVDGSVATRLRKMKDSLDTSGGASLRAKIGQILGE